MKKGDSVFTGVTSIPRHLMITQVKGNKCKLTDDIWYNKTDLYDTRELWELRNVRESTEIEVTERIDIPRFKAKNYV